MEAAKSHISYSANNEKSKRANKQQVFDEHNTVQITETEESTPKQETAGWQYKLMNLRYVNHNKLQGEKTEANHYEYSNIRDENLMYKVRAN